MLYYQPPSRGPLFQFLANKAFLESPDQSNGLFTLASFNQFTMWLWVHFDARMDTSSGLVLYTVRSFMFTGRCLGHRTFTFQA